MFSHLELMKHQVEVLFRLDSRNRMTVINEPPYDGAPRIFVGATPLGNEVRYSDALDANLVESLERIIGADPGSHLTEVIHTLSEDQPINHVWIGPAYVFPDFVISPFTKVVQVTNANKELLKTHFPYTFEDFQYKQPCFVILEEGIPVSMCCSARHTLHAAEASVFTHEDFRGRGYGVDVANAWAAEVQKQGRIALYSTSWDNFSSQSLAKKLGLVQYGTDIHIS